MEVFLFGISVILFWILIGLLIFSIGKRYVKKYREKYNIKVNNSRFIFLGAYKLNFYLRVATIKDTETGVIYLMSDYGRMLTPLLDEKGNVMIEKSWQYIDKMI